MYILLLLRNPATSSIHCCSGQKVHTLPFLSNLQYSVSVEMTLLPSFTGNRSNQNKTPKEYHHPISPSLVICSPPSWHCLEEMSMLPSQDGRSRCSGCHICSHSWAIPFLIWISPFFWIILITIKIYSYFSIKFFITETVFLQAAMTPHCAVWGSVFSCHCPSYQMHEIQWTLCSWICFFTWFPGHSTFLVFSPRHQWLLLFALQALLFLPNVWRTQSASLCHLRPPPCCFHPVSWL